MKINFIKEFSKKAEILTSRILKNKLISFKMIMGLGSISFLIIASISVLTNVAIGDQINTIIDATMSILIAILVLFLLGLTIFIVASAIYIIYKVYKEK